MNTTKANCFYQLSLALSRYVGYTTGAYILFRIANITGFFKDKPSIHEIEIKHIIEKEKGFSSDYSKGVINFGVGLGLLQRYGQGGRLSKLGLTDLGRTYKAAHALDDKELMSFLLTFAVLQYDCDIYGLLLNVAADYPHLAGESLHEKFLNYTKELRKIRYNWIKTVFPNPLVRAKVAEPILWIKTRNLKENVIIDPEKDFARHHANPRKGWAIELGHLTEKGEITDKGIEILNNLTQDRGSYFWLGPPQECFKILNIENKYAYGPNAPAWNLLRPNKKEEAATKEMTDKIVNFMEKSYESISLVRAKQASLGAIIPYIYFLESYYNIRVNENETFKRIFTEHRSRFAPMAKRTGQFGHYQLRKLL